MRNSVLPVALLFVVFTGLSCVKSDTCSPKSVASEVSQIEAFANANSISPTAHASGLYYEIVNQGSGLTPSLNSKIVITYTGTLLNGTIFDQRTVPNNTEATGANAPWPLGNLIEAWRIGLPLIQKGGHIRLIVPSAMAYGCTGYGTIPRDAILYFDINLVDVIP